jgi:hypothetical protein
MVGSNTTPAYGYGSLRFVEASLRREHARFATEGRGWLIVIYLLLSLALAREECAEYQRVCLTLVGGCTLLLLGRILPGSDTTSYCDALASILFFQASVWTTTNQIYSCCATLLGVILSSRYLHVPVPVECIICLSAITWQWGLLLKIIWQYYPEVDYHLTVWAILYTLAAPFILLLSVLYMRGKHFIVMGRFLTRRFGRRLELDLRNSCVENVRTHVEREAALLSEYQTDISKVPMVFISGRLTQPGRKELD